MSSIRHYKHALEFVLCNRHLRCETIFWKSVENNTRQQQTYVATFVLRKQQTNKQKKNIRNSVKTKHAIKCYVEKEKMGGKRENIV